MRHSRHPGNGARRRTLALLLVGAAAAPVAAQAPAAPPAMSPAAVGGLLGSPATYAALNVWVGGVTAAFRAQRRGTSPWRAAALGALGGATTAAGQRLIGVGPRDLRFAGLQLAAVGANVARNAGDGVAPLSDVVLPVYPFYVRIRPGASRPVSLRLSAVAAGGLAATLVRRGDRPRLDVRESLRSGAPVFRSPFDALGGRHGERAACTPDRCAVGLHFGGTVLYAGGRDARVAEARGGTLRHEAVHAAQFARDGVLFGVPASHRVLSAAGDAGRWASGWLVADVTLPLLGANLLSRAASADADRESLYEREVRAMLRR